MIPSMVAMLRISLRRSLADWPIGLAAGIICLLAATLLAAGSIYAGAVSTAGLHRVSYQPGQCEESIAAQGSDGPQSRTNGIGTWLRNGLFSHPADVAYHLGWWMTNDCHRRRRPSAGVPASINCLNAMQAG